jgi:hypothetical protein
LGRINPNNKLSEVVSVNFILDEIKRLATWFRRLFNRPGQRFAQGDTVTHKIGHQAKVIRVYYHEEDNT